MWYRIHENSDTFLGPTNGSSSPVPQTRTPEATIPINYVGSIRGNLVDIQGAQDPNVTPDNVYEVETRLHESQVQYKTLFFEDEEHSIVRPANQAKVYPGLARFFKGRLWLKSSPPDRLTLREAVEIDLQIQFFEILTLKRIP